MSQLLSSIVSSQISPDICRSVHTILNQTQKHLDLTTPTPLPVLHNSIIELASRITHHFNMPHPLSSLIIVGVTQMESLVRLIASSNQYTFVRPSQMCCSGLLTESDQSVSIDEIYNVTEYKNALKNIYSTAAVKVNNHSLSLSLSLSLFSLTFLSCNHYSCGNLSNQDTFWSTKYTVALVSKKLHCTSEIRTPL